VAAEVRALAQRSSQAAGQIRGLISSSVEGVQSGARRAAVASDKIAHVGQSIDQVSSMIDGVSAAASMQSREIHAITRALGELDGLTQDNTHMVSSWTDRASHLRAEVQRLAELVGRFRLPQEAMAEPTPGDPRELQPEPRLVVEDRREPALRLR
jgi:methyl-accepting chemotaxis protein